MVAAGNEYGAKVPFITYEAESAKTTGKIIRMIGLPAPNEETPAIEASGRSYVRLDKQLDGCEIIPNAPGNSLVLRYSIPDAPAGGGTTATLSLYINDRFQRKLTLDSRYNWLYGDSSSPHGGQLNAPRAEQVHVFWNDTRFLLSDIAWRAGDRLRLQKDADDEAEYYGLDLIDLELAPPPFDPPNEASFLSIVDFGATANDQSDDTKAIKACIAAAKERKRIVWFPPGEFHHSEPFFLDGVQVQGAGMWHTELIGTGPMLGFVLGGSEPRVADLFIESTAHHSRSDPGGMVFRSREAQKWSVENVWITHVHVGCWLSGASHGTLRGCRIYCTYADAINLNRGSNHNVVEQNYVRGAGDDGIASLALKNDQQITTGNLIRRNTIIANWWGHNIDIAGGEGHVVENNYLADNSHSGCFTFNHPSAYPMHPLYDVVVRRNRIVRGGGNHAGQERGALWSFADDTTMENILIAENEIIDPIFRGLHLHGRGKQEVVFRGNVIKNPGTDAIRIDEPVTGSLTLEGNTIRGVGPSHRSIDNAAAVQFELLEAPLKGR